MPIPNNGRFAQLLAVVDGDTLHLRFPLHAEYWAEPKLRLARVYAPELTIQGGAPNPEGIAAREYVQAWCAEALAGVAGARLLWPFVIVAGQSNEVHGRWLGRFYRRNDGRCLNEDLVRAGHATYR